MAVETLRGSIRQIWDGRSQNRQNTRYWAGQMTPVVATSGTDKTPVAGTIYASEVFIPTRCVLTGVKFLIGSVGGTHKVIGILWDANGNVVANHTTAGTVVGTAATVQTLAFTSAYKAEGPALYYIGLQFEGTTPKFRTHIMGGHWTTSQTGAFGTVAALTLPTDFVADVGPYMMTY